MRPTLEEVISAYQNDLFRAAFAVCKNRADAEDAVQDTYLRYYRSQTDFDGEAHVKAWLLRVAINRSRDLLRARPWRRWISLEDSCPNLVFGAPEDGDVLRAVMRLPRKYREAVFLYYYEGYSVAETAKVLRARENTVKSRLRRARALLKESLREEWNDDES